MNGEPRHHGPHVPPSDCAMHCWHPTGTPYVVKGVFRRTVRVELQCCWCDGDSYRDEEGQ
jgi:hypothetical protein